MSSLVPEDLLVNAEDLRDRLLRWHLPVRGPSPCVTYLEGEQAKRRTFRDAIASVPEYQPPQRVIPDVSDEDAAAGCAVTVLPALDHLDDQQKTLWLLRQYEDLINDAQNDSTAWKHLRLAFGRLLGRPIYEVAPRQSPRSAPEIESGGPVREFVLVGRVIEPTVIEDFVEAAREVLRIATSRAPADSACLPESATFVQQKDILGVSLLDAALILNDADDKLARELKDRWHRLRSPRRPPSIGICPEHQQVKLYAPDAICDWIEKIEDRKVCHEHKLRQRLMTKARSPRK